MPWAPAYVTLAELKSFLRIDTLDTEDDAELTFLLDAASRAIDRTTNRQFGQVATAEDRRYTPTFDIARGRWVVEIDDLQDVTGLVVETLDDEEVVDETITDFRLHPFNSAEKGKPFERIVFDAGVAARRAEGTVRVTALWGWNAVPDTIVEATLIQANRFNARRNSPFGIAGSPEMGNEIRLLAQADPDVRVAVRPFRREWGAA